MLLFYPFQMKNVYVLLVIIGLFITISPVKSQYCTTVQQARIKIHLKQIIEVPSIAFYITERISSPLNIDYTFDGESKNIDKDFNRLPYTGRISLVPS